MHALSLLGIVEWVISFAESLVLRSIFLRLEPERVPVVGGPEYTNIIIFIIMPINPIRLLLEYNIILLLIIIYYSTTDAAADRVGGPPTDLCGGRWRGEDVGTRWRRNVVRRNLSAGHRRRCLFLHKYNYNNSNNIYTHTRRASNKHNYNKYYKNILFINAAAAVVTPRRYHTHPQRS